jgi:hypothetical protein
VYLGETLSTHLPQIKLTFLLEVGSKRFPTFAKPKLALIEV